MSIIEHKYNCKKVTDQLFSYLEGVLSEEDMQAMAVHSKDCPCCTHLIESYKRVQDLLQESKVVPRIDELLNILEAVAEEYDQQSKC